jgi:hypothetical protein
MIAAETVAVLRLDAGRHPDDPQLAALVGEFSLRSPEFPRWWADHSVSERTHGRKRYRHPFVGDLTIEYEALCSPDDPEQTLFIYSTEPGSPSGRDRPAQQLDQRQGSACTRRSCSRRRP